MNSCRPCFSVAVSADASPCRNLSNGALGVMRLASNTAIAFCAFASDRGCDSPGNAVLNFATYPGMAASCSMTCSGGDAISTGFTRGPPACSFRSLARPSQNCTVLKTALKTVGALRPPRCQRCPIDVSWASTPPSPMLWQELQLIAWLADSRGSKYSMVPSSTLAGVAALPGSAGGAAGIGSNRVPSRREQAVLARYADGEDDCRQYGQSS